MTQPLTMILTVFVFLLLCFTDFQSNDSNSETIPALTSAQHVANRNSNSKRIRHVEDLFIESVDDGPCARTYPSGKKFCSGQFRNGYRDGEWSFWHETGEIAKTAYFNAGVPAGVWIWYREDGTRKNSVEYHEGFPVRAKKYNGSDSVVEGTNVVTDDYQSRKDQSSCLAVNQAEYDPISLDTWHGSKFEWMSHEKQMGRFINLGPEWKSLQFEQDENVLKPIHWVMIPTDL